MEPRPATESAKKHLAANVRRLRMAKGLTQEALAEIAGISTVHLQRIERGASDVRLSVLVALALSLRVSPDRLLTRAKPQVRPAGRPPIAAANKSRVR